jgi:hypothetical protein
VVGRDGTLERRLGDGKGWGGIKEVGLVVGRAMRRGWAVEIR